MRICRGEPVPGYALHQSTPADSHLDCRAIRIASPEMLPSIVVLPHLKCSQRWLGGKDEEGQYGDAERIG
jgi:hypothetical protein